MHERAVHLIFRSSSESRNFCVTRSSRKDSCFLPQKHRFPCDLSSITGYDLPRSRRRSEQLSERVTGNSCLAVAFPGGPLTNRGVERIATGGAFSTANRFIPRCLRQCDRTYAKCRWRSMQLCIDKHNELITIVFLNNRRFYRTSQTHLLIFYRELSRQWEKQTW